MTCEESATCFALLLASNIDPAVSEHLLGTVWHVAIHVHSPGVGFGGKVRSSRTASSMATLLESLPQPLQKLIPPLEGEPVDLLFPLYFGLGVLALRLIAERTVLPWFKRVLKPYAAPDRLDKTAFKVFENAFTSTFCGTLAVWAWYVTLFDNGGCTPFNTKPCLSTWPDVPLTRQFQLVWLSIGGYYTYEMIGTVLRMGCILNTDMIIHHLITMTMMVSAVVLGQHAGPGRGSADYQA